MTLCGIQTLLKYSKFSGATEPISYISVWVLNLYLNWFTLDAVSKYEQQNQLLWKSLNTLFDKCFWKYSRFRWRIESKSLNLMERNLWFTFLTSVRSHFMQINIVMYKGFTLNCSHRFSKGNLGWISTYSWLRTKIQSQNCWLVLPLQRRYEPWNSTRTKTHEVSMK